MGIDERHSFELLTLTPIHHLTLSGSIQPSAVTSFLLRAKSGQKFVLFFHKNGECFNFQYLRGLGECFLLRFLYPLCLNKKSLSTQM